MRLITTEPLIIKINNRIFDSADSGINDFYYNSSRYKIIQFLIKSLNLLISHNNFIKFITVFKWILIPELEYTWIFSKLVSCILCIK